MGAKEYNTTLEEGTGGIYGMLLETDPEERLYHYCGPGGLYGTLKNHEVWAGHLSAMNDSTELDYAEDLMLELIDQKLEVRDGLAEDVLRAAKDIFNPFNDLYEAYAYCLSEQGDLLSQWRGYTDEGRGFAIGFNPTDLSEAIKEYPHENFYFRKVVYDRGDQEDLIELLLDHATSSVEEVVQQEELEPAAARNATVLFLRNHLGNLLWTFKSDAFEEEQEWRIVYSEISTHEHGLERTDFRTADGRLLPYVVLDPTIPSDDGVDRLPIEEIVLGPGSKERSQRTAVELARLKYGYNDVETTDSTVPLKA